MFRDDPEHRSIKAVADRSQPRSSSAAAGRLEQSERPWGYAELQQEPVGRVQNEFLKSSLQTAPRSHESEYRAAPKKIAKPEDGGEFLEAQTADDWRPSG